MTYIFHVVHCRHSAKLILVDEKHMLLWCKKVYFWQTLYFYVFIGYIMFCTFHEIQTFVLLILTAANLVPVSLRESLLGRLFRHLGLLRWWWLLNFCPNLSPWALPSWLLIKKNVYVEKGLLSEILLHKYNVDQREVISSLLFLSITY